MPAYKRFVIAVILCTALQPWTVAEGADIHPNAGTRAMPFLKIGIGARAIGMGESQVADASDLYASYWNPAGLARVKRPQIGLMHNEWFEGINHEFFGFVNLLVIRARSAAVQSSSILANCKGVTRAATKRKNSVPTISRSFSPMPASSHLHSRSESTENGYGSKSTTQTPKSSHSTWGDYIPYPKDLSPSG